jgi:hypothetical protein
MARLLPPIQSGREFSYDNEDDANNDIATTTTTTTGGAAADAVFMTKKTKKKKTKPALVEYGHSTSTALVTNHHDHDGSTAGSCFGHRHHEEHVAQQRQPRRLPRMSDVSAEVDRRGGLGPTGIGGGDEGNNTLAIYNGGGIGTMATAGGGGGGLNNNGMVLPIRKDKTVITMTADGIHKIQSILGVVTRDVDDDEMSFFCTTSDDAGGCNVLKQKLSLGGGGGDERCSCRALFTVRLILHDIMTTMIQEEEFGVLIVINLLN